MPIFSRVFAALALCFVALFGAQGATASELQASKAVYSVEAGSAQLQLVSYKPCCYFPRTGQFGRNSAKTCARNWGQLVDDRYCQGNGYNWRDDRWRDPRWNDNRGHVLCCKRARKEWWVQSREECWQRRGGQIVHPSYCVKH